MATAAERKRRDAVSNREFFNALKLSRGCCDCGYNKDHRALEFDHRPGTKGKYTVATLMYRGRKTILDEVAKCDVRCCTCHAIMTFERRQIGGITADTTVLETVADKA